MNIIACNNINSKTVRLEYTSSDDKPKRVPSYTISADKADEFVEKYNKQTKNMAKFTTAASILGGFTGLFTAKDKSIKTIPRIIIGTAAGFLASTFVAYKLNSYLMKKYNVKIYNE